MRIVYHPNYNISFFGIENLHPFDSRKYGRAWAALQSEFGEKISQHLLPADRPVTDTELGAVHDANYLASLRDGRTLAGALELATLALVPASLTEWRVLRPMRWAVRGSILAAESALKTGVAVNLSGGYHHAKPGRGEGFCLFSDIALLVAHLRTTGKLATTDRIAYIDLDAHQGNGVSHQFLNDTCVSLFDMFNGDIYPREDTVARQRIDWPFALSAGTQGREYLGLLQENLPLFLDSFAPGRPALAIYNAGTDVFSEDQLGGLNLTAGEVLERDLFTIGQLRERKIPTVMLLSGGYSRKSYQLVAATVSALLGRY